MKLKMQGVDTRCTGVRIVAISSGYINKLEMFAWNLVDDISMVFAMK